MRHLLILLVFGTLTACGGGDRSRPLHDLRDNQRQPEEFSILPAKPLQTPDDLSQLPRPTPGGTNRTDQTPLADAVAVLGGDPERLNAGGVARGDGALLSHVSRFGTNADIRSQLAREDAEFRKRNSRFTWTIVPQDNYARAYRRQLLNPYFELNRMRRLGVSTPAADPPGR